MDKVILNGKLIEKSVANISVFDKGNFFDFSVYSSVKVVQGKVFYPEYHVERLFESAELIGIGHSYSKTEVVGWINELVKNNEIIDGLLRVLLVGDAENNTDPKLFIFKVSGLTFYPDSLYKHGAKVVTYEAERRIPKAKSKDLLMSFLAYRKAKGNDAMDALLIDRDGFIREGTRTNFFAIKGDTVISPPTSKILDGITRKLLLEAIRGRFKYQESDIPAGKLDEYDEFFITSTSMNVMPISEIDDKHFPSHAKTREIVKLFKTYVSVLRGD